MRRRLRHVSESEVTVRVLYLWIPTIVLVIWWARIRQETDVTGRKLDLILVVTLIGIALKLSQHQMDLFRRGNQRFVYAFFPVFFFMIIMLPESSRVKGSRQVITTFVEVYIGIKLTPAATAALVLGVLLAAVEVRRQLPPELVSTEVSDVTWDVLSFVAVGLVLVLQFTLLYWYASPVARDTAFNPKAWVIAIVAAVFGVFVTALYWYLRSKRKGIRLRAAVTYVLGILGFGFATPYVRDVYTAHIHPRDVVPAVADPIEGLVMLQICLISLLIGVIVKRSLARGQIRELVDKISLSRR